MKYVFVLLLSVSALAETVHVGVNGMVCSMCAQGIKKKFAEVPAVKNIAVDLDKKLVTLETEGVVEENVIRERIKEAGYDVTRIHRQ
jgi:periplasmic mercuric ion binding protein